MAHKIAIYLNQAGIDHVASEIARLGLAWGVEATVDEITDKPGFIELQPGDEYTYEITNTQTKIAGVGSGGYGVLAEIKIDTDKHVIWREVMHHFSVSADRETGEWDLNSVTYLGTVSRFEFLSHENTDATHYDQHDGSNLSSIFWDEAGIEPTEENVGITLLLGSSDGA